jgi:EmrB/QacA subfamily drug resistance transporter
MASSSKSTATPGWCASLPDARLTLSAERMVVATVALATMLAPLNSTMIAVALPTIMVEFGADVTTVGWLVTAYLLGMASLQPVAGKLGDRFGRRPLILGGLVWFGLASLGATLADSLPMLIAFRLQQALAGAAALPNATALVRDLVPAERRASRFGQVGAVIALAAAAGPPLGGFLVDGFGWRSIFWVNLPLVVVTLLLGWQVLRLASPPVRGPAFDLVGAVGLSALLLGLAVLLSQHGRGAATPLLGGALLVGGVFWFRYECRRPDALLRLDLFRRQAFAAANAAVGLSNLATYVTLLALPLFLATRPGVSGNTTGLLLAAMSGGMVLCAPLGGRLADRLGRRLTSLAGLALQPLGALPLAFGIDTLPLPALIACLAVLGTGLGLASAPLQTAALEAVEAHEAGVAAGLFSTSRYLGSIVGSVLLGGLASGAADPGDFDRVFGLVVLAGLLAFLAGLALRDAPRASPATDLVPIGRRH